MRILKAFPAILALAVSARAAAPVIKVVPEISFAPAARPLIIPGAVSAFTSAPGLLPVNLTPSPLPAPAKVSPLAIAPIVSAVPAAGDAPGKEEEHYAKFFDGIEAPKEGSAVSPHAATAQGPTLRQPMRLTAVQHAVRRAMTALRESVALGQWTGPNTTLDESCCGDAAPKLALLLRAQGVPARLVESESHYYVILDLPDGQIVVDPTVRQFFGKKQAPRSVPQVFVGTIAELNSLFHRHPTSKTTRYEPSRIYFNEAVVREDALLAFERKVRAGGAPDHEPLRRFLGLSIRP